MKGWVLVTGAAKRIGRGIALELAAAGWNIVVHYHSSQREAAQTAEDIQALGRKACLAEVDLADLKLVQKLIPTLTGELGPLAALVNNASLFLPDRLDPDNRQRIVNAEAPRVLGEAFHKSLHGQAGSIVNILDADPATPGFSFYNSSKKMLATEMLSMAKAFMPSVRVNGIALGPVLRGSRQSSEHFRALVKKNPLGKPATPKMVASSVRFLIEDPSLTGATLYLDGGLHHKFPRNR